MALEVVGLDASAAMLAKLAEQRPDVVRVTAVLGDMVDDLPDGPFGVVFVAYNTFFNLLTEARQQACFAAVGATSGAGRRVRVEAFVPEPQAGPSVVVRSMTADSVVLSITTHDDVGADRAGSVRLVQRGGRRAPATVGDSLRDRRAARRDGDGCLDFVVDRALGGRTTHAVHRRERHATSRCIAQFTAPSALRGSATS